MSTLVALVLLVGRWTLAHRTALAALGCALAYAGVLVQIARDGGLSRLVHGARYAARAARDTLAAHGLRVRRGRP